jgi:hypothetical protein
MKESPAIGRTAVPEDETKRFSGGEKSAGGRARRKIYIRERIPAVAAEMKALSGERKELLEKRKHAQDDQRQAINRRWNFVAARLDALREERAALIEERDGMPAPKRAKESE